MLQTRIATDPDIVQAVDDKLADVAEIRDLLMTKSAGVDRARRIGELFADIYLRAGRIKTEPHELIRLVSAELDRRSGRKSPPAFTASHLRTCENGARIRERAATKALAAAQKELDAAASALEHAQARCLAFGIEVRA